jgi:hypothetical protein
MKPEHSPPSAIELEHDSTTTAVAQRCHLIRRPRKVACRVPSQVARAHPFRPGREAPEQSLWPVVSNLDTVAIQRYPKLCETRLLLAR